MTPFDLAAAVYSREPQPFTFEEDLREHLSHGYVVSTPEVFAMLRPIWSEWQAVPELWHDPAKSDPEGDCWFIWCAAGDVACLFKMLPPKKLVAFARRNTPRVWQYDRLRRLFLAPKASAA